MRRSFLFVLLLTIAATMTTVACERTPIVDIKVLRHFANASHDRIFVVAYNASVDPESMRFFGKRATNTSGRNTTVYFYRSGAIIPPIVRQATTLAEASDAILGVSRFSHVFTRALNGVEYFASCSEDPSPDVCSYSVD